MSAGHTAVHQDCASAAAIVRCTMRTRGAHATLLTRSFAPQPRTMEAQTLNPKP